MPVYEYGCKDCGHEFDVVKSFKEYDLPEACQSCQSLKTERYISRSYFYGEKDWDKVEFNPAFGCLVKNKKHREQLAKERNLIEIGNEDFDKTCKSQDEKSDKIVEESTKEAYSALEYGLKKDYLSKR